MLTATTSPPFRLVGLACGTREGPRGGGGGGGGVKRGNGGHAAHKCMCMAATSSSFRLVSLPHGRREGWLREGEQKLERDRTGWGKSPGGGARTQEHLLAGSTSTLVRIVSLMGAGGGLLACDVGHQSMSTAPCTWHLAGTLSAYDWLHGSCLSFA